MAQNQGAFSMGKVFIRPISQQTVDKYIGHRIIELIERDNSNLSCTLHPIYMPEFAHLS